MIEIRLAKDGEVDQLKKLWKTCFGDEDTYINLYFDYKYKPEETAVLLWDREIVAMTTMIPAHMVMANGEVFNISMLYAIATHPGFQGKGLSTRIMDFCHTHLKSQNKDHSILVPAQESLFDFYGKRGYKDGFYIREVTLTGDTVSEFLEHQQRKAVMSPIAADDYNKRRRGMLEGYPYVDYAHAEIAYQKKLCQQYGGDLYALDIGDATGCAVVERISPEEVLIKELLVPDDLVKESIREIAIALAARIYHVRMPVFLGEPLEGVTRHFGMAKNYGQEDRVFAGASGYLGIAYD